MKMILNCSLIALACLGSASALAASAKATVAAHASTKSSQVVQPSVSCEFMYSRVDTNNISEEFKVAPGIVVTTKGVVQNFKGFTVEAKLIQQCAEDSNECSETYQLQTFIKRDLARSQMHVQLDVGPYGWQRYSSALDVGKETGFLNCDYETRKK